MNTAASAAAMQEHAMRQGTLVTLAQHVPSLSEQDESDIYDVIARMAAMDERADVADLAKRTCSCGKRIDGFYEYVDHLTEVFRNG